MISVCNVKCLYIILLVLDSNIYMIYDDIINIYICVRLKGSHSRTCSTHACYVPLLHSLLNAHQFVACSIECAVECLCQYPLQKNIVWVTANHHIYGCKTQQVGDILSLPLQLPWSFIINASCPIVFLAFSFQILHQIMSL